MTKSATNARILIVDDDAIAAQSLADFLAEDGYRTTPVLSAAEALEALKPQSKGKDSAGGSGSLATGECPFDVCVCDVTMPGVGGMDLLRTLAKEHPRLGVIMLTGYGTIESAVEAVRCGAEDYLIKPVVDEELRQAIERVLSRRALGVDARGGKRRGETSERAAPATIVGVDPRMQRVYELIDAVAKSRTTVLMTGESGVGKSMIARAIHERSPRAGGPFVQLSCGSIPETLLESELFGHVKGAFTGAYADKVGRFLAADGGTLFLDEINSASAAMQLKLLRVLQEKRFEAVGSTQTIEVDVRVVLASNKPLEDLVARGEFRQDLYYRINVVTIDLPPLRERPGDVEALAAHFLERHGAELGRQFAGFTPEAMEALRRYSFPGNVRELENIIERATVLSRTPTIGIEALPENVAHGDRRHAALDPRDGQELGAPASSTGGAWTPMPLEDALREPERRIILRTLAANGWNRQKTADDLKINRTTLYKKMRQLGIDNDEHRQAG